MTPSNVLTRSIFAGILPVLLFGLRLVRIDVLLMGVLYSICLSFVALLYYDYLLTLDLEIKEYWPHPVNKLPTVFFYLNRYGSLLGHIGVLWGVVYTPSTFDSKAFAVSCRSCLSVFHFLF